MLDVPAWAIACTAWAHGRDLDDLVTKESLLVATAREGTKIHPALRAAQRWWESYGKMAAEFGMTPASRASPYRAPGG